MAMGHVILKEFFVDRQTPYFTDYVKQLHRPAVPGHASTRRGDGAYTAGQVPDRRRPRRRRRRARTPRSRPCCSTRRPASRSCPTARSGTGSATRASAGGTSTSATSTRVLSLRDSARRSRSRSTCRASTPPTARPRTCARGVPVRRVGGHLVTTVFDLLLAQYGVGRDGLPGDWPTGYDDADAAVHAGLAGGDHRRAGRGGGPDRPRVRRATPRSPSGRSMIVMGAGHQPLVPLRHDLPRLPHPDQPDRLPGRQRRRLGALRRPGEGPAAHRLHPDRQRAGLEPAAAQHDPDRVLVPAHRPVPLRPVRRRHPRRDHRHGPVRRQVHRRRASPRAPGWAGCRRTRPSTATRSTSPTRPPPPGKPVGEYVVEQLQVRRARLRRRGPGRARRTSRASCRSGGPTCSAPRARATSTSSSTCSAPTRRSAPTETPRGPAPASTCAGATRRPRASSTC